MRRDEAIAQLPDTYRQILTWLADGRSNVEIAHLLGVEREAIDPLIDIANAKLTRLVNTDNSRE